MLGAVPLVLLLTGCSNTSDESSYADRDWSAVAPVVAGIPQVREPEAAFTRANLRALDPCAVGAAGDAGAAEPPGKGSTCTVVRGDGTVQVDTAARYFVDGSGPDAVSALDSRDRLEIAGIAAWVGEGPITAGGSGVPCAVVVPASLEQALAIIDTDPDCTAATAAAEAALADLGAVSRAGQNVIDPIFYGADEADPGGAGGCTQLGDQIAWLCAPVGGEGSIEVPTDPVDLIRRGEADPQILCVPALESARATAATTGRSWVAVTTAVGPQELADRSSYDGPRQCTLLAAKDSTDGSGAAEGTEADDNPATIIVSARRQPLGTEANADVAGHPTYHSELSGTWEVALTDTSEHGFLRIEILDTDRTEPAWAEDLVEDLAQRTFG
ncbi:hypothetical protein BH09ACT12_BH09ACT12_31930 [soil metagenome]